MLHIYTKMTPEIKLNFVNDVELFFKSEWRTIVKHESFEYVLKTIDKGTLLGGDAISTPFGTTSVTNISTGSKALLIALSYPKFIVNFLETGNNVLELASKLSDKYDLQIYMENPGVIQDLDKIVIIDGIQSKYVALI